jgi:hypothetical protein
MSRYERRIYFERLVELRLAYATLGDEDRIAVMTIDEAVAWAERELGATVASESAPGAEA